VQDAEMCWMLQDEQLCHIPDLQGIAKKLRWSRLAYVTAIGVVELTYLIYMYCWVRPDLQSVAIWAWCTEPLHLLKYVEAVLNASSTSNWTEE
jgi:hypothetical protein